MAIDAMSLPKEQWPDIPGYELLNTMGSGTYGVVFKARQRSLDRFVKIKYFLPISGVKRTQETLKRFAQEAKIISKLEHPNIEVYHDFVKTKNGFYFIVTEYFEGVSVNECIKQCGPYKTEHAFGIIIKVCECIKHCHDRDVIHRDLKPSHIIINDQGLLKVVDFGVAYDFEEKIKLYSTTSSIGTVPYICPEQRDDPTHRDKRNDIYSIGIILYEMLVGHIPDIGATFKPVSSIREDVDERIDDVINKCLKRENERYQTMEILLDALKSLEFLREQEKKQWEERRKKASKWAQELASQKNSLELHIEKERKKIEEEQQNMDKVWMDAIVKHMADLEMIVEDLKKTRSFNLTYKWLGIEKRPTVTIQGEGPILGEIQLSAHEILSIRLSMLNPTEYPGIFIQPGIIWETSHSRSSGRKTQERIFAVEKDGAIKVFSGLFLGRYKKNYEIQDVYRDFFKNKVLLQKADDNGIIENIVHALSSTNYHVRCERGYDVVEKITQKQLQLPYQIADALTKIITDNSRDEEERIKALKLLQESKYMQISVSILDSWLWNNRHMSSDLNKEFAQYFATSNERIIDILEILESSEPLDNMSLYYLLGTLQIYTINSSDVGEEIAKRIIGIIQKYENTEGVFSLLNQINEKVTGKPLKTGRETPDK